MAAADFTAAAVDSTGAEASAADAPASVAAHGPVSAVACVRMAGHIAAEADSRREPMADIHIEVLDSAADRLRDRLPGVSGVRAALREFATPSRMANGIPSGAVAA